MKNLCFIFLSLVFIGFCSTVKAQNISNEGSEFWLAFATHDPNEDLAAMNVNVTSKEETEVTVSCGSYKETKKILANTVVVFEVPRNDSYVEYSDRNHVVPNKGIHVVVTPGKPNVSVYSHVYAGYRSAASLILPIAALGQRYYSVNYTQDVAVTNKIPARNFLLIVATEANTNLYVRTRSGINIPVTLNNVGDVYEYIPDGIDDLTGTLVEVDETTDSKCKKFAAFSGSTSTVIVDNGAERNCGGSRDPLYQQLYPTNSWGKNYGIVPFFDRRYILRILAQEDNTTVNIGGGTIILGKGAFYESATSSEPVIVSADKLISVAQYSLTQGCSAIDGSGIEGDPEMVLLNPIEFNINKITLFSAFRKSINHKYINIFMRTDRTSSFKVNGQLPANGTWLPMPTDPTYSYIQIEVGIGLDTEESLTLTAADGFNAIAYGFGNAESYGYSAGTNLASSQFLTILNKVTNEEITAACTGQEVEFKLTTPYLLSKIDWAFDDGTSYAYNAPSYTQSVVNGLTLYTYKLDDKRTFVAIGTIKLKVTGNLASGSQVCGSQTNYEFNYELKVVPLPTAKIGGTTTSCFGEEVSFKDLSTTHVPGKIITRWLWDFGDPSSGASNTSDQPNPTHIFATKGNHTVKLMVGSEDGCLSDVDDSFDIFVNVVPQAKFNSDLIKTCVGTEIKFTDISTVAEGNIVKWSWDFGDPSAGTDNISNVQNPKHTYTTSGNFNVTLTVETDKGCTNTTLPTVIEVNKLPIVDFTLPEVCLDAAFAVFKNNSVDFDGSKNGLTYEWNFGDTEPGAINNISTLKDGSHTYSKAKEYTVTLTVTNTNGCQNVKTQKFTVNSSNPLSNFEKVDQGDVCSNKSFSLKNTSSVPGVGVITRLEWYFDGKIELTDENPTPNQIYVFTRPKFTAPLSKDIVVTLKVFTGDALACSTLSAPQTVTLLASPEVEFNPLTPVCANGGNVQLVAKELGGLAGSGSFSGKGVSPDGIFNPSVAKAGPFNITTIDITYTFITNKGCVDSKTQQIQVYPTPQVNGGGDFYILSGGQKQIPATASGVGLTYKWTPSTGLNRDDILNPIASPEKDTKYTLTITSNQGCTLTDQLYVYVLQNVEVPNTFTPNGDGVNDLWNIKYLDTYPNATVEIYDRNGQKVFASVGYAKPFDGFYQNRPLPVGTYYYIINPNSGRNRITGNLTIIR